VDDGYVGAQSALMTDPDIVLFIGFAIDAAIGASNYVMAQPDLDVSKMAAFGCGLSETAVNYVDLSATNETIVRGLVNASSAGNPWDATFEASYQMLFGLVDVPHFFPVPLMTYNDLGYEIPV